VVFADVCKTGPSMPLGAFALELHKCGVLSNVAWSVVGAAPTYNPLGSTLTFLSEDDVLDAAKSLLYSV
jgi:hypothetical protein